MEQIELTIRYDTGETVTVRIAPRDILEFERKYNVSISALADGKYEYICYLGWQASKRTGSNPKPFESWVDTLEWIGLQENEGDAGGGKAEPEGEAG